MRLEEESQEEEEEAKVEREEERGIGIRRFLFVVRNTDEEEQKVPLQNHKVYRHGAATVESCQRYF